MCVFAAPLIEEVGNVALLCNSCTSISYRYLVAMMQGQDPVNFDLDDYNAVEIKASASTIGEYSAGVRMNTRKNATGHRCATL